VLMEQEAQIVSNDEDGEALLCDDWRADVLSVVFGRLSFARMGFFFWTFSGGAIMSCIE